MLSESIIFGGVFILFYFGFLSFGSVMNKIITLLALVRYEMFTAKSALRAMLAIYNSVLTERAFMDNCKI